MSDHLANRYLIIDVDERYALPISKVTQIIAYTPVTAVPETPAYIIGVINNRGAVVPVIDLRLRFKKPPAAPGVRRCIVIVDFDGLQLGLVADNVVDLRLIPPEQITPPPQLGNDYAHVFVRHIGVYEGEMNLILDESKIVNHSELDFLDELD